jgi:2-dehydropantoate 2-reductase
MSEIAVVGPGAIGGLVAAWLCQDPNHEVSVCARTPIRRIDLETPYGPIEATPGLVTEPGQGDPVDWILVATKAYDSEAATAWFEGLMGAQTRIAVLQNGVDHVERFSAWLPAERIVPVIVDCPTERREPEKIHMRGAASLVAPSSNAGNDFIHLFERTRIEARVDEDFISVAWRKLCLNAAGVVNALTLEPARISHDPHAASVMQGIVREAIAVGRAEGADLDDALAGEVVRNYQNQPGDGIHSLLADRLAGRPMEIDLRNGVIVRLGRKHGIETPCNKMAVDLLKIL